jgi:hypothetical protein
MRERAGGGDNQSSPTSTAATERTPGRSSLAQGASASPVDRALEHAGQGQAVDGAVVHTDGVAAEAASSLNAHAFAAGQDIYFGAGQYRPGSAEGQQLISHEMAHVQQARGVPAPSPGNYSVAPSSAAQETEARLWAGGGAGGGAGGAAGMMAAPATIYRAEIGTKIADQAIKHGKTPEQAAAEGGHDGAEYNMLDAKAGGADAKDPLQAFRLAVIAGSKSKALAAWPKVPAADKAKLKGEHDTLLRAMQVIGPKSLDVLKDVGFDPTSDVRFAQEILWHGASKDWATELTSHAWTTKFLQGHPRRYELDKKSIDHLDAYVAIAAHAQDAFEKAYTSLKTGNIAMGTMTFHGNAWDADRIKRLYKALDKNKIPPSHLRGSTGIWLSGQVEDPTGTPTQPQGWGYYDGAGGIVLPDYAAAGYPAKTADTRGHDMVGAKKSKGPAMGHFESSALHEVGHLVGGQTGAWNWGTNAASPLQMAATTAADVQTDLWKAGASHALPKGGDPVSEADAKLFLEQEALHTDAFGSTAWNAAGKLRATFDTNLAKQYHDQPLFKMAKTLAATKLANAYTKPWHGEKSADMMFAYLTRFGNTWAKYKKEAWDKKVSEYAMSSPQEWFAEQYSYYISTGGKATIASVKTKLVDVMKSADKAAGHPAMTSPGAGAGAGEGGPGAEGAANTPDANPSVAAPVQPQAQPGHRFEFSWN